MECIPRFFFKDCVVMYNFGYLVMGFSKLHVLIFIPDISYVYFGVKGFR